jgi:peptidoglycan/LPS O-acetylase OafA/YrhL
MYHIEIAFDWALRSKVLIGKMKPEWFGELLQFGPPKIPEPKRIPSLDGLRGMSILLVLLGHLSASAGFFLIIPLRQDLGNLGVRVFFVISGYLITYLLLKEESEMGVISLKSFYTRRIYRIFPAFYAYIAFIAGLSAVGLINTEKWEILGAITFTSNFYHARSWYTGHLWSLSVEEQFYLLWPTILRCTGRNRAFQIACGVFIAAPLFRICVLVFFPEQTLKTLQLFPTVADSLAIGCMFAGARELLGRTRRYLGALRSPWFLLIFPLVFLLNYNFSTKVYCGLEWTILNIAIGLILDRVVRYPMVWPGKVLNSLPFTILGVLSYSLYLWQQPFLNRNAASQVNRFPTSLMCALSFALISYLLIEKPFMQSSLKSW